MHRDGRQEYCAGNPARNVQALKYKSYRCKGKPCDLYVAAGGCCKGDRRSCKSEREIVFKAGLPLMGAPLFFKEIQWQDYFTLGFSACSLMIFSNSSRLTPSFCSSLPNSA